MSRPIKDEEIAAALGMNLAQWHRTLKRNPERGIRFFGARTITAGPTTKRSSAEPARMADHDADPFELCYRREQREILRRALSRLRERERQIVTLYYQEDLTMKQIADRMNVDESRVSQLHTAALARLKASVNALLHSRQGNQAPAPVTLSMAVGAGA